MIAVNRDGKRQSQNGVVGRKVCCPEEVFLPEFNRGGEELKHGKKYIAGTDSLTIADFMVASIVFSHVHNDSIVGGATFTDIGKAIVAKNEAFAVYVERLRTDLSDYLATR